MHNNLEQQEAAGAEIMIHPTAVVHPGAEIAPDCRIGPYCVIGEFVSLGRGSRLHSHVVIDGHTTIGAENEVFPFVSLGLRSQDAKWTGGTTRTLIGDRNVIREFVTIHSATLDGAATTIGSDNTLLANCHLAHDVTLGNHILISNVGTLAGHVVVEDHAVVGGLAAILQTCRVGRCAMVGGGSKVTQDVPPFMIADGNPATMRNINKVGLDRAGVSEPTQSVLRQAYKILSSGGLAVPNALIRIEAELPPSPELQHLVEFIRASRRGITK